MSDIKEYIVSSYDSYKKVIYLAKEFLNDKPKLKLIGSTYASVSVAHVAETLVRLGYVQYDDIQTETAIIEGRRQTRLNITIHKTANFEKLYKENEERKKKFEEERNNKEKKEEKK